MKRSNSMHSAVRRSIIASAGLVACACLGTTAVHAVPLSTGDAIKIDFSTAGDASGGSLADWNQVHTGLNTGGIAVGAVKRHGGGTVDGVGITLANVQVNNFNNDGASANWGGTAADPYYILAADDIYFHGSANDFSATVTGLDPNRDYNVRIYSLISNNGASTERFIVSNGGTNSTADVTRATRWNAATLEAGGTVFSNVRVNGAGNLVVTVDNISSTFYPLNAIVIEANDPITPNQLWSVDISGGPTGNGFGDAVPQAKAGVETNYGLGNVWNQYFVKAFDNVSPAAPAALSLVDSAGAASPVSFRILGNVQGWTGDAGQGSDPLRRDYLFLDAGQSADQVAWEITGLQAGGLYELYAYGGATRSINILVDQTGVNATVTSTGFLFANITADSLGRITGLAGDGPVGGEQNWAGFQLRQLSANAVPEPATFGLLSIASFALLRRRRTA